MEVIGGFYVLHLVFPIQVHGHKHTRVAKGFIWAKESGWLPLDQNLICQSVMSMVWYACVSWQLRILAAVVHAGNFCFAPRYDKVCPDCVLGGFGLLACGGL